MLTQEEKLKKIYEDFGKLMKKISEETISEVVSNYVPYAEGDLEMNVYTYSRELVKSFLSGIPTYDWQNTEEIFIGFNSAEVRRKMFVDYREEIINQIMLDQEVEILNLKKRIEWLEEVNSSRRY